MGLAAIWPDNRKERVGMILEPLQSMAQLALLSYCPIGSKLSISTNILHLQLPCLMQPMNRAMNADKKDDLIFLFNVITRFHKFYGHLNTGDDEMMKELFSILTCRAKIGLENLIRTYSHPDCAHLSQTLRLYVQLIMNPGGSSETTVFSSGGADIDDVFGQVTQLYTRNDLYVLTYLLRLLESKPDQYLNYLGAVNSAMAPVNEEIKKWISNNIVY